MAKKPHRATQGVGVNLDEPPETIYDETEDYEIFVEIHLSNRSVSGLDTAYGIRHKRTGVVEMRWGGYAEALQGIVALQDHLDKCQYDFAKSRGKIQ